MKKDRLNIHYETLLEIILVRHKGLKPILIKEHILNKDLHFEFEAKENSKTNKNYETKKVDYINAEVTKALNLLSKKPLTEDEVVEDDPFSCEDDEITLEEEDSMYYPHSLIIGEPEKARRKERYRLNRNIDFNTKEYENLKIATKQLYSFFQIDEEASVTDDVVRDIVKRKNNSEPIASLLTDTFTQISSENIKNRGQSYTIQYLLSLSIIKSPINISIEVNKSQMNLSNVIIEKLIFDIDSFEIKFDGIQLKVLSTDNIKSIESSNPNSVFDNIDKVKDYLSSDNISNNNLEFFIDNYVELKNIYCF